MKIIRENFKKHSFSLLLLIIISFLIWFYGPFIPFSSNLSLELPQKRFYLITLLTLLWALKVLIFDLKSDENIDAKEKVTPNSKNSAELLEQRFSTMFSFLKTNSINQNGLKKSLIELPWYLMIGPTSSGKTTLLANSHIHYILSKQFDENLFSIPSSETCDWWISRNAILIDTPAIYFSQKKNTDKNIPWQNNNGSFLWNKIIELIKNNKQKKLDGVIIALNLPELFHYQKKHEKRELVANLKSRITELRKTLGPHLPFYLVITKCDLLTGFSTFFSECSSEELTQAWGITLPNHNKEPLLDTFSNRFNALIKRINKQIIWRLHQERDPQLRPLIKDFPQHLERLKESIVSLLKTFITPDFNLAGVYLTSAVQTVSNQPATYLHTDEYAQNALQLIPETQPSCRSYFIRQFLLQALSKPLQMNAKSAFSRSRRVFQTILASLIIMASFIFIADFRWNAEKTYLLQTKLNQFQSSISHSGIPNKNLAQTINLLDSLYQLALHSSHPFPYLTKYSIYSIRTQDRAKTIYYQATQNLLIFQIKNTLENYLQSSNNPEKIYGVLKAYLMLENVKKLQMDYLLKTLNDISPSSLSKDLNSHLGFHLNTALQTGTPRLNQNLILQIRKKLIALPNTELAFIILKNVNSNNANSKVDLGTDFGKPPIFISKNVDNIIPNMFIAERFPEILAHEIPKVTMQTLKGNNVLGMISTDYSKISPQSLLSQLNSQYISKYIDLWESLIVNIQPYQPNNLIQANKMIAMLTSNHSPLLKLLNTIKQNTNFLPINNNSAKIRSLNHLLIKSAKPQENLLYQIFVDLNQLHLYLNEILSNPDVALAASNAARERINKPIRNPITQVEQIADESPEPLKSWLHTIARQSWDFIVNANMPS